MLHRHESILYAHRSEKKIKLTVRDGDFKTQRGSCPLTNEVPKAKLTRLLIFERDYPPGVSR